jgi:hypothetical protein
LREQLLAQIRGIKNGLGAAFAVANVDKDEAAEVTPGMDPAGQGGGLPDVSRAQFVAMVRAFHVNAAGKFPVQAGSSQRMSIVAVNGGILKRFFAPGFRARCIFGVGKNALTRIARIDTNFLESRKAQTG